MSANAAKETFWYQLRLQLRVIWALMLRETVTRFQGYVKLKSNLMM